ncbi:MAG TPA: enoyl-CoA hydratase-related protein [Bacillota bacterium]|jgi:enoyl-CoA hydratase|nr:enoyl-CoA hydratase-related protein [Bacillota bacterium]HOB29331.1 enoyl-CoA hydratase-related protein [Bacillota bacterium]HPZ41916.1 enoyl-CoA hydratase-related protein [Bacillota bacterium]HQD52847.1 enoyl-CoA hydratase-related protein [Bacillota bacterium]
MSDLVKVVKEERLAIVTINHPPVNALNSQVMELLEQSFDELVADESIGAVIITGAGEKAFVAGADINEFTSLSSTNGEQLSRRGQLIFQKIEDFPAPVIAAVNGFALGGGLELTLCCDIRVMAENARVGLPEVTLGIFPGYGGTQRLPRTVAPGKAKELIYTGDMIDAAEAYRIGLADRLVPPGEALPEARKIAKKILERGPIAIRLAKQAVNRGLSQPVSEGFKTEALLFGLLCDTEDQKEGAAAFLEKRPPVFKGK